MWVLFLFALFVIGAYFLPEVVTVERDATIDAPSKVVFAQINDLHSWEKWSVWNQLDPDMNIKYFNHGIGEGAGYKWDSANKHVGTGKLQIVESTPYDSIVTLINFTEEGDAKSVFNFEETDSVTHLIWKLTYNLGYNPFTRWMGLMMEKFIGPDFDKGLENLKIVCEVQVQEKSLIEELVDLEGFNYASIRRKVSFPEVGLSMQEMFETINNFIASSNTEIAGVPFTIYHEMKGEEIDIECGIPISILIEGNKTIITSTFSSKRCATVNYYGDYQQLEDAHTALQSWIEEREFKLAGPPVEFYFADPRTEQNPKKWLTKIYYPVK